MTTTVIKVRGTTAPAGLPVINVTTDEYGIIAIPSLIEWFRADTGVSGSVNSDFKWTGRKSGYQLVPTNATGVPSVIPALQNGKAAIALDGLNELYNAGDNGLWPVGSDYTIAVVARTAPGDNASFLGNMAATDFASLGISDVSGKAYTRHRSNGAIEVQSAANGYGKSALFLMLVSYDYATKTLKQIVNRTDVVTKNGGVADITNSQMRVGMAGAIGSGGFVLDPGGAVAEILTFNKALHKAEHAESLALVQNYLMARYAIA